MLVRGSHRVWWEADALHGDHACWRDALQGLEGACVAFVDDGVAKAWPGLAERLHAVVRASAPTLALRAVEAREDARHLRHDDDHHDADEHAADHEHERRVRERSAHLATQLRLSFDVVCKSFEHGLERGGVAHQAEALRRAHRLMHEVALADREEIGRAHV